MLIDHLPGGEFHSVTDPAETLSVPKTNLVPERVLDRLMSQKPNATHIALESMILFSQNKTSKWFKQKSSEEKERLLQAARKLSKVHRRTFKERKEEIKGNCCYKKITNCRKRFERERTADFEDSDIWTMDYTGPA